MIAGFFPRDVSDLIPHNQRPPTHISPTNHSGHILHCPSPHTVLRTPCIPARRDIIAYQHHLLVPQLLSTAMYCCCMPWPTSPQTTENILQCIVHTLQVSPLVATSLPVIPSAYAKVCSKVFLNPSLIHPSVGGSSIKVL